MDKPGHQSANQQPLTSKSLIVEAELWIERRSLKVYLKSAGIKCLDCPAAEIETFEQGAAIHGFNLDKHIAALNALAREHPFDPSQQEDAALLARFRVWLLKKLQDKPQVTSLFSGDAASYQSSKKIGFKCDSRISVDPEPT